MSKYVCLDCYEIYEENFEPKKYNAGERLPIMFCPKHRCEGCIVELDENMIGIIIELNKIGLTTSYCCGGHVGSDETDIYIAFSQDIESSMLGDLPDGFELEDKDLVFDKVTIRFTVKDDGDELDLLYQQRMINEGINNLNNWVFRKKLELDAGDEY